MSDLIATYKLQGKPNRVGYIVDGLDALQEYHPAVYDRLEDIHSMDDLGITDRQTLSDAEREYLEHVFAFRKAIDKSSHDEMLALHMAKKQGSSESYTGVKQLVDNLCEEFRAGAPAYIVAKRLGIGTSTLHRLKKRFPVVQETYEKYRGRGHSHLTVSATKEELDRIVGLFQSGNSKAYTARVMGMSDYAILKLCKTHSELQRAYEESRRRRRRSMSIRRKR